MFTLSSMRRSSNENQAVDTTLIDLPDKQNHDLVAFPVHLDIPTASYVQVNFDSLQHQARTHLLSTGFKALH